MRLRAKMPLVVGLAMALLFVVLLLLADLTLLARAAVMEDEDATASAQRLADLLDAEVRQIDRTAQMLAAREDTYRFVVEGDAREIDADFAADALANIGVNFAVFLDEEGQSVRRQFVDLDLEAERPVDAAVVRLLESTPELRLEDEPRGVARGYVMSPSGPALVAARPIVSREPEAAPAGTLVLGRYLDAWETGRLSALAQMPVQFAAATTDVTPAEGLPGKDGGPDASTDIWWDPLDENTLVVHAALTGLDGRPVGSVSAELPRDLRTQGIASIWFTSLAILIIGIFASATVFVLLDRAVLRRLARLSEAVSHIRDTGDVTLRVDAEGRDELSALAADVNAMLEALEATERELEGTRDDLELRVEARTAELSVSEQRYRGLLERMADAVFCVNLEGRITLLNGRAAELVGALQDDLLGARFADLVGNVTAEDVEVRATDAADRDAVWTIEVPFGLAEGKKVPVELRGTALVDEGGGVAGTQWIVRDMSERKKMEQQLLHMASHDHLTGLRNRRSFEQALEMRLAEMRRGSGEGAIVWLDLDEFKEVNDTLGHRAGDEVLVALSEQLRKHVRESNMLARLGGDEFAILLAGVSEEEAAAAAARILTAINAFTYVVDGRSVRLSASVGVVMYPQHGTTVEELLANADLAMYQAKEGGRSQIHVHQVDDVWRETIRARDLEPAHHRGARLRPFPAVRAARSRPAHRQHRPP